MNCSLILDVDVSVVVVVLPRCFLNVCEYVSVSREFNDYIAICAHSNPQISTFGALDSL